MKKESQCEWPAVGYLHAKLQKAERWQSVQLCWSARIGTVVAF
ncbi:hypothetical protein [Phaeodactylibacter xiamenensis]|nr:hypothetical protein [Phaeodactylibacter xiamenensis]MCR9055231.1 hypothetical protein [bacterium]